MAHPEQPRGFERAPELQTSYNEVADDYSSRAQADAAADLVRLISEKHKSVDRKIAKAMLREMVETGGDLDLDAVRAMVAQAEQQYDAAENEITEEAPVRVDTQTPHDETSFFRVEPKARVEAAAPPETAVQQDAAMWEGWRAHLRTMNAVSEDGMDVNLAIAQQLGLTNEQAQHIARLQRAEYLRGSSPVSERRARVVDESVGRSTG